MRTSRIILLIVAVGMIAILYFLPKGVVENDSQLQTAAPDTISAAASPHRPTPRVIRNSINRLRARYLTGSSEEKNAIFADSLVSLYQQAGLYDSAAWYADKANSFFKTKESLQKAANASYEAYSFAVDPGKQKAQAEKTRALFAQVLERDPSDLEAKTKTAMTYLSESPMKGVQMLREVIEQDPSNELALFNMGMLSIQSGQYGRAIDWFEKLLAVNPDHLQGNLLLGVAYLNQGEKEKARKQFEKVKKLDSDPAVQATVDSYLQELK